MVCDVKASKPLTSNLVCNALMLLTAASYQPLGFWKLHHHVWPYRYSYRHRPWLGYTDTLALQFVFSSFAQISYQGTLWRYRNLFRLVLLSNHFLHIVEQDHYTGVFSSFLHPHTSLNSQSNCPICPSCHELHEKSNLSTSNSQILIPQIKNS